MRSSIPLLGLALTLPLLFLPVRGLAQARSGARMGYGMGKEASVEPVHFLFLPEVIIHRLNLTAAQQSRVAALRKRVQSGFRDAWQSSGHGANQAVLMRKMKETALQADRDAVDLLTYPQRKRLGELQQEAASYEGLGRYNVALLAVKSLTADQKHRLKTLAASFRTRRSKLPPRPLPQTSGPVPVQALNEQAEAEVRKILTPEQVKQAAPALAPTPPQGKR